MIGKVGYIYFDPDYRHVRFIEEKDYLSWQFPGAKRIVYFEVEPEQQ